MITAEISIGLLVIKILKYSLLALFVVGILIAIFSKKVARTQKTGFWLDMAFAPLGLIYEFIVRQSDRRGRTNQFEVLASFPFSPARSLTKLFLNLFLKEKLNFNYGRIL